MTPPTCVDSVDWASVGAAALDVVLNWDLMSTSTTLAELLRAARNRLDRVAPDNLQAEIDAGAMIVDVRDSAQRSEQGELPGAHVIDLTVLEWRLAPSSEHRVVDLGPEQRVVLVCSEGFSSSLAAARLQDLGIAHATDPVQMAHAMRQACIAGYLGYRAGRIPRRARACHAG